MDEPSRTVATFLESLQDAMQRLGQIHGHYRRRGTFPMRPFLVLSGRPFTVHEGTIVRRFRGNVALGLDVKGTDGREYGLIVDVLWGSEHWTITTQAWVQVDAGGQEILQELPERTVADLDGCAREIGEAIEDLVQFEELVPGKPSPS